MCWSQMGHLLCSLIQMHTAPPCRLMAHFRDSVDTPDTLLLSSSLCGIDSSSAQEEHIGAWIQIAEQSRVQRLAMPLREASEFQLLCL